MSPPGTASAVIIGGGVVGCSIAYHLARRGLRDVVVLERETVGSGTTSKAAGGIRVQFSTETEIRFSLESIKVFERFQERSEEHTSELQSRFDLVCRLLLEKKNTN